LPAHVFEMAIPAIAIAALLLAGTLACLRWFSADVYDMIIVWMTSKWYEVVFSRLKDGDRVLDVGIGTATALVKNKALLLKKRLSVVGIDYEAAYVRKAEAVLREAELLRPAPAGTEGYRPGEFYCRVLQRDIYDPGLAALCTQFDDASSSTASAAAAAPASVPEDERFDAVYFSGSISLMPDPAAALRAVAPLLKQKEGRVYITQTFQKQRSPVVAAIKPLLKYVTTIDFGQLTTIEDLGKIISSVDDVFESVTNEPIEGSLDTWAQQARLIILRGRK